MYRILNPMQIWIIWEVIEVSLNLYVKFQSNKTWMKCMVTFLTNMCPGEISDHSWGTCCGFFSKGVPGDTRMTPEVRKLVSLLFHDV